MRSAFRRTRVAGGRRPRRPRPRRRAEAARAVSPRPISSPSAAGAEARRARFEELSRPGPRISLSARPPLPGHSAPLPHSLACAPKRAWRVRRCRRRSLQPLQSTTLMHVVQSKE